VSVHRSLLALRVSLLAFASCGGRTDLLTPEGADIAGASADVAGADASPPIDKGDTDTGDTDALPPIDVAQPRDVVNACPNAAATLVYVITTAGNLMSFFPPTASFATIGHIACPAPTDYKPFSMGVDRAGVAYVLFTHQPSAPTSASLADPGQLFRVSTATASCRATGFVPEQQGFSPTFGMGFSADTQGTGETLYVASNESNGGTSSPVARSRLAWIDTGTFALHLIGTLPPNVNMAELTGTGAGDLFAFYRSGSNDSIIGQVDKATARVTAQSLLVGVNQGNGWAFAFWGGDFYTFTAPSGANGPSMVTRFRPSDRSITPIARTSETVVGAGVSTCAPQQ
jgi:hypothetical protein